MNYKLKINWCLIVRSGVDCYRYEEISRSVKLENNMLSVLENNFGLAKFKIKWLVWQASTDGAGRWRKILDLVPEAP